MELQPGGNVFCLTCAFSNLGQAVDGWMAGCGCKSARITEMEHIPALMQHQCVCVCVYAHHPASRTVLGKYL